MADLENLIDTLAVEMGFEREDHAAKSMLVVPYTLEYRKLSVAAKFIGNVGIHPGGVMVRHLRVHPPRTVELIPKDHYRPVSVDVLYPGSVEKIRRFLDTGKIYEDS